MTNEDADLIVLYNEFTHTVDDLEEAIKQEKQRAEEAQKQLRTEKQRAEEEKQRAEDAQKQQRLIAAKAMKNDGMPIEQIARYLNLTPDELAQL
jgi:adenosine/AMP kinase